MYQLDQLLEKVTSKKASLAGNFKQYNSMKDPCPVFDGRLWHIFGSGGDIETETWVILHAISKSIDDPWTMLKPAQLIGVIGPHVAAPGVIFENGLFHMFVQTEFMQFGGTIEYLTSKDGNTFKKVQTILQSDTSLGEAGIYDPHPAIIDGGKYIVYTGFSKISHGDLYLAYSITNLWSGPWERMGRVLSHEQIPHHNPHDHLDYEWGLEGAQLVQLPTKKILLNAVCFLPEGLRGSRQRVFFAIADQATGPYTSLGPVLTPSDRGWDSGENGHAGALVEGDCLHLFFQARPKGGSNNWRYGIATWKIKDLEKIA